MKTAINYDLGEIRKLVKRWPDETREEMRVTMDRIVRRLEAEIVKRTPAGIGGSAGLRGSIAGEVATLGRVVTGTVGTPLEYGEVVEMGRRPGKAFPPVDPIALWARRKLGVSEKESRGVGFAIARKIAIHGFEGVHMFEKGWQHIESWAQKEMMGIGERVVRRVEA